MWSGKKIGRRCGSARIAASSIYEPERRVDATITSHTKGRVLLLGGHRYYAPTNRTHGFAKPPGPTQARSQLQPTPRLKDVSATRFVVLLTAAGTKTITYTLYAYCEGRLPHPRNGHARAACSDHHRTCVASTGVMSHPAFQFYYRNVLLFFNRKTVSGPPSCARSPCRQWSPEHGRLDNVFGQHPSLHKERSAINRSLGILKALYTVIMSTNIILLPGAVRQHNDRLCLTVRCC